MTSVIAEVMDKEPSTFWLFSVGLALALVARAAVMWKRWLAVLFVPLAICVLIALTSEIRDPYVGAAIIREAGYTYVAIGWISGVLPVAGCAVGWSMPRHGSQTA